MPDEIEKIEAKMEKVKRTLERESNQGPIRIKLVDGDDRKSRARRQRR